MIDIVSQLLSAFVGALGFALIFGMRKRYLFAASLGALLGWGVYMLVDALIGDVFLPSLAAAARLGRKVLPRSQSTSRYTPQPSSAPRDAAKR